MNKLEVKDLKHTYLDGTRKNNVLKGINASFKSGKLYAIIGESGSGKTTLLSLMAALDSIQSGDILYNDQSLNQMGLNEFRLHYANIIFQSYNLITYLNALENIEIAIDIAKIKKDDNRQYAYELLEQVGIDRDKANRPILKLSGGEQQRVAIARSMVGDVPIILADEPTGNLDGETEAKIIGLLKNLAKANKIVIVVSHSKKVAAAADVIYHIKSGIIG